MEDKIQAKGYLDPDDVVKQLEMQEGDTVADLGCGKGYFVIPLAKKVGKEGKVFAIDILENALENVQSAVQLNFLDNVIFKRINLEERGGIQKFIRQGSLDLITISNVLFANEGKENIILESAAVLKTGKDLVIIDWKKSGLSIAPPPELLVDPEKIMEICLRNGLIFKKDLAVGNYHWGKVFLKK